jgi:hypothetical protein
MLMPSCLQATVITFANKSPYRVRALWVDFSGNEVRQQCFSMQAAHIVCLLSVTQCPCKVLQLSSCSLERKGLC